MIDLPALAASLPRQKIRPDMEVIMDIHQRIESEFARLNRTNMTDKDVIREIAEIWADSGGEADGLDEYYIEKIKVEVNRICRWRKIA